MKVKWEGSLQVSPFTSLTHLVNHSHVRCEESREGFLSSKDANTHDRPDEGAQRCHAHHDAPRLGHLAPTQISTAQRLGRNVEALKELDRENPTRRGSVCILEQVRLNEGETSDLI